MTARIVRKARWGASRIVNRSRRLVSRLVSRDEVDVALTALPDVLARSGVGGQVVVVTGSTRGVGLSLARALTDAKARVVVNGRNEAEVARVAASLAERGEAIGVRADVATPAGADTLVKAAHAAFGRVDILINNAAVLGPSGVAAWMVDPEAWRAVIDANLTGPYLCSRAAAIVMLQQPEGGRIINVSSGAGKQAAPGVAAYVASKFGLEGFTQAFALDAPERLTVVGLELGTLRTDMSRAVLPWDEWEVLAPPETVIPAFLYAATAPRAAVHGRILAAWRFERDADAEAMLTAPLAIAERAVFPPLRRGDEIVERTDPTVLALDRAENLSGMPPAVRDALIALAPGLDCSRYPDEKYPALRRALGEHLAIPEDWLTFGGNGSAELVERLVRTFAAAGEEVISSDPSWFMFDRFCDIGGVINRKVPFRRRESRFDHDLDAIAAAITPKTRLIYLVNPSNPIGVGIDRDAFARFLDLVPPHLPVVLDEAYVEFSDSPRTVRSHEVVGRTDRRVIGLRTFSKFYGLAALRVGYALAAPSTMRLFNRLEPMFAVSPFGEAAALAALGDVDHARRTRDLVRQERERVRARVTAVGLECLPSEANFMLVEAPGPVDALYRRYENARIFMPRGLFMDRYILFPIASPGRNDRTLDILCGAR